MRRPFLILAMMLCLFNGSLYAINSADEALFKKSNQDYKSGKFKEATEGYEKLATKFPHQWVFNYNLGNSAFRAGDIGKSVLSYERARMDNPRNDDVRKNLNYVKGQLEYRVQDKRNWYLKAAEEFLNFFTMREISISLFIFYFLLMIHWVIGLFLDRDTFWKWPQKTAALLLFVSLLLFSGKYAQAFFFRDAIVMEKEAQVRYGPTDSDQVAFRLGEGLKVYVVDRREEWSRIVLTNGDGGWIRNDQIAEVKI